MHQPVESDTQETDDFREYFFLGCLPDGSSYVETNMTDEEVATAVSEVLRQGAPVQ